MPNFFCFRASWLCYFTVQFSPPCNIGWIAIFFSLALQPQWALAYLHETLRFTSVFFLSLRQSVGLLGRVISSSQGLYLYTNTEKRTPPPRTHHHGFRASEDSSRLRPLGYRDRLDCHYHIKFQRVFHIFNCTRHAMRNGDSYFITT
jgi:hypothetical protein